MGKHGDTFLEESHGRWLSGKQVIASSINT